MPKGVYKKTPEHIERLRQANIGKFIGKDNPMYGRHHSEVSRDKISQGRIGRFGGENNNMYGKHHSEITRKKISLSRIGRFTGNKSNFWRGGKRDHNGYIQIYMPNHPAAGKRKYVSEHRLVVEKRIGRYLCKDEVVHHKNGIKDDNRDENLMLMRQTEHLKIHMYEWLKKSGFPGQ